MKGALSANHHKFIIMNRLFSFLATVVSVGMLSFISYTSNTQNNLPVEKTNSKIQAAILLDVSNSMDGLIEQAKNQLWNMVNVLSKVTCDGNMPTIEIALYEYGRPENNSNDGFVKQISPFTSNLDFLFRELINLRTHGGDEYCGRVMYNSLRELNWDSSGNSYKVIFISGNESFLQGNVSFATACAEAKRKGVIVNTIYCGPKDQGIRENWNLGAECGGGSFTNIDQNAQPLSIPTPYDSTIITLKEKLNETYIVYGVSGRQLYNSMLQADTLAIYNLVDPTKLSNYIVVKSNRQLNSNPDWDLVDALRKNANIIDTLDMKTLDDSLKNKNRSELKKIVETTGAERKRIQDRIAELSLKQEKFIKTEKEKQKTNEPQTLESEIERIIRDQVKRVKMKME
jgi:hypothetical protein